MKKNKVIVLGIIMVLILCSCGVKDKTNDDESPAQSVQQSTESKQDSATKPEETKRIGYGYHFVMPTDAFYDTSGDGFSFETEAVDIFSFVIDYIEFESWNSVVDKLKRDMSSALFQAFRFMALDQTATTEKPFTNDYGVEMMRVNGNLKLDNGSIKPYIAYYYVTDENYVRFIVAVNYDNEVEAAKMIDYMAAHLKKA